MLNGILTPDRAQGGQLFHPHRQFPHPQSRALVILVLESKKLLA
jgi:hypothetical protein